MTEFVKLLNNCLELFNLCKPKESTNNSTKTPSDTEEKLLNNMNDKFTLILPSRPKVGDELRIKAKLKSLPKEFILTLGVDSSLRDDGGEPAMIAFHFNTRFTAHPDGKSGVFMSWKRGPNGWEERVEEENTWIDDDVEEVDIGLKFTKQEIHFISGQSIEYQFKHKYEINRIDRLQVYGDVDHIKEVALKYHH